MATKKPTNGKLLPNINFTRKNSLDKISHPHEWAELDCDGEKNEDELGYKFENFTLQGIEQQLSLYIFRGLNPSPQLIMKIRSQSLETL